MFDSLNQRFSRWLVGLWSFQVQSGSAIFHQTYLTQRVGIAAGKQVSNQTYLVEQIQETLYLLYLAIIIEIQIHHKPFPRVVLLVLVLRTINVSPSGRQVHRRELFYQFCTLFIEQYTKIFVLKHTVVYIFDFAERRTVTLYKGPKKASLPFLLQIVAKLIQTLFGYILPELIPQ